MHGYRLVGYGNRILSKREFKDDCVASGELGYGEEVTVFNKLILANSDAEHLHPLGG